MALQLYLVRHGQTTWNVEKRFQGFSDEELNETGLEQARLLGLALRDKRIDAVYASTLRRAIQTAEAIAQHHGLPVLTDPDLREMNQGEFEGRTIEYLSARYPDFLPVWREHPADIRLPGGECLEDLQCRAWSALQRIVERHPHGTVAVCAHNLANLSILCKVTGSSLNEFRKHRQDGACLNLIEWENGTPTLVIANDTSHLASLTLP